MVQLDEIVNIQQNKFACNCMHNCCLAEHIWQKPLKVILKNFSSVWSFGFWIQGSSSFTPDNSSITPRLSYHELHPTPLLSSFLLPTNNHNCHHTMPYLKHAQGQNRNHFNWNNRRINWWHNKGNSTINHPFANI